MLRWAVVLLVLANAGYFAWTRGYLDGLGMAPVEQREPERLAGQVKPEALRLLNGPKGVDAPAATPAAAPAAPEAPPATGPAATADAPAPAPEAPPPKSAPASAVATNAPRECWQATGFTEPQVELLRAELALLGLPASSWQFTESRSSGRWIVYMGRYDNIEQVERKKAELRALGVQFRELTTSGLAPGLALGTYSTEAAARQALQQTEQGGVRTAKVAQERAESVSFSLRLPSITDAQRASVDGLREAMAGKTLRRCG
ncbi:SPOR domain-containing protein [Hydrogenophaga laconesensis]|uniref:SPOR domain-containing protein n=1 Tax=Hydrogenophaga laconesensis TaxID=1805971 RepID=A0ABU1VCP2_9BURK|nr:SPOR domain-containing protein [Hydrogenophaga laconesensis]MDR7095212.1 hypothetical protein [Hydrogenophaga laconesensis]